MYLLRLQNDGPFNLKEFIDGDIPHYAILSHTWDRSSDEVTFQDVHSDAGDWKAKKGYKKLIFLEQQARKDGLDYFWIDTCCINKESSAEHSEAINSMFRWYQRAQKCYVYLSDVYALSLENELDGMGPWKRAFQRSRWFTRIWTLQELLAPNTVEFFSADRVSLGLREILHKEINEITGIPTEALTGHRRPMFKFTVGQRVRWARNRKAKREEDVAYALLGIFDVNMPLIYGEGKRKALARLDRVIQEYEEHKGLGPFDELSVDSPTTVEDTLTTEERYLVSMGLTRTGNSFGTTIRAASDSRGNTAFLHEASNEQPNHHKSHRKARKTRDDDDGPSYENRSTASSNQFNAYGGPQINNTGNGYFFNGSIGRANFGQWREGDRNV